MKLSRNMWIGLSLVVAVIVIVLLVVLLPSGGGGTGGTPTQTAPPGPTATATGIGYPTATATGVGYPTATATGVGYPTPTATRTSRPTSTTPPQNTSVPATATPPPTVSVGPNTTYFDQSVYNVQKGGNNFYVYVMWSGRLSPPCYFWGGQFDIFYDDSLITLVSASAGVIDGLTADTVITANGTHSGKKFFFLSTDWNEYIWDLNNANGINGSGYWVKLTFATSAVNSGTTGLNFSEARVPLEAISQWANGYISEYTEGAVWINSTVHVQ